MSQAEDIAELHRRVVLFCEERGYKLSPEAGEIFSDMVKMKEATGDFYCPCQTQRNADTICVCTPVRNGLVEIMGTCFCNLVLKNP